MPWQVVRILRAIARLAVVRLSEGVRKIVSIFPATTVLSQRLLCDFKKFELCTSWNYWIWINKSSCDSKIFSCNFVRVALPHVFGNIQLRL